MIIKKYNDYTLLLSHDPADVFRIYNVTEMHGLNINDCLNYNNTCDDSYIAGLCNYIPKDNGIYNLDDPCFIFINLTRCKDEAETMRIIFHELMHMALKKYNWDLTKEEEIITWADSESYFVFQYIKSIKNEWIQRNIR